MHLYYIYKKILINNLISDSDINYLFKNFLEKKIKRKGESVNLDHKKNDQQAL